MVESAVPVARVYDITAVHIAAGAIYANLIFILAYLWWRRRDAHGGRPWRPGPTIAGSLSILVLWLGLSFLVGLEHLNTGDLALGVVAGTVFSMLHPVAAVSFFIANLLLRPWELIPEIELYGLLPKFLAAVSMCSWLVYRMRRTC